MKIKKKASRKIYNTGQEKSFRVSCRDHGNEVGGQSGHIPDFLHDLTGNAAVPVNNKTSRMRNIRPVVRCGHHDIILYQTN